MILCNSLFKDRIASERIIQADEAAAELKEGDKAIVQAAAAIVQAASISHKLVNGMSGKMYRVPLA